MRKTAILLALACAFARADYGPGTTDSDLLRSGTPVVTNAWLAVSNETANFVRSVAGNKITDGTNTIDAARNVYLVYENCWIRRDGYVLTYIGDGTWKSIKETPYGYIYLDERSPGEWYETVIAIPDIFYRDGDTLTNETGMVMYRYGPAQIPVGRLALTNDIPTVTAPDFTTNNAQLVATIEAKAPAPGNYLAVSNAAMNARGMTDLAVRGSPQGEGSYFLVNGEIAIWIEFIFFLILALINTEKHISLVFTTSLLNMCIPFLLRIFTIDAIVYYCTCLFNLLLRLFIQSAPAIKRMVKIMLIRVKNLVHPRI